MMVSDRFGHAPGEWLAAKGAESDIVISTRVRLARNVRGRHMPWKLTPQARAGLDDFLTDRIAAAGVVEADHFCALDQINENTRHLLVERHLISREHAQAEGRRSVAFSRNESVSIMTLEEDHLRIQALGSGLVIEETWGVANALDDRLEHEIPYAFSRRYGFLTACPSNVGSGLRVSVMLHLPMLVHTKQIDKVNRAAAKVGLVLRGLHGEGTEATGDFYQISNQVTLGKTEDDLIRNVHRIVAKVVEWERGVRNLMLESDRTTIEDRVWRAYGFLRYARRMTSEETLTHLSAIRLGVHVELLRDVNVHLLNELFLYSQPAHLQLLQGETLTPAERDVVRARYIRERLGAAS